MDFVLTKSLSSSRRIPVLSRERYDRNRPSTTRLISEGDLIDLLSKVSVYIIFHFMRFLILKRRTHHFVKGNVFSAKFKKLLPSHESSGFNFNSKLSGNYLINCKQMIMLWD
jgi:hypothetical protein